MIATTFVLKHAATRSSASFHETSNISPTPEMGWRGVNKRGSEHLLHTIAYIIVRKLKALLQYIYIYSNIPW